MHTVHHIAELRQQLALWKQAGERIALVPTMGNLHQGHLHLIECARQLASRTVATIFVNPMQFGENEDYGSYPRTLEDDSRQLEAAGLDMVFAPAVADVYPRPLENMTQVSVPELSHILCGVSRPAHFRGVTTIVSKLFHMVQPDIALFGEKDWQQLIIIKRMATDLDMPIEIVGVPIVRESDGLAMSSRNSYLSASERAIAPKLYAILTACAQRLKTGERHYALLEHEASEQLANAGFRPDYVAIRRADDLQPPTTQDTQLRILAAARLGQARLIDNLAVNLA